MSIIASILSLFGIDLSESDERLEAMYRDLTNTYTPTERCEMTRRERETHNENAADVAFWGGADSYTDYDGRRVKLPKKCKR